MSENGDKDLKTFRAKVQIEFFSTCPECGTTQPLDTFYSINEIQDYKEIVSCCGKRFIASIEKP